MKIELDSANRMFMVFSPSRVPIFWTAARKASASVSTIAFRYGKTWAELVADGYELRKLFYTHMQATHKTMLRRVGPVTKAQMHFPDETSGAPEGEEAA